MALNKSLNALFYEQEYIPNVRDFHLNYSWILLLQVRPCVVVVKHHVTIVALDMGCWRNYGLWNIQRSEHCREFHYLKAGMRIQFWPKIILDYFKNINFCFYTLGVRRTYHRFRKMARIRGSRAYRGRLLKISFRLRYRTPDPVFGQIRILFPVWKYSPCFLRLNLRKQLNS